MSMRPLAVLFALTLPLGVAHAGESPQHWQKTFAVTGRPSVTVTTGDGQVRVRTGPPGQVSAEVRYESRNWGWTSPRRDPVVDLHQVDDAVTIVAREPSIFVAFGGVSTRLEVEVVVPADCDLDIGSGDGSVTLEQAVRGRLSVHTGDGSIRVRGATGDVRLSSGDGRVAADSLDGNVAVRTSDGVVDLGGRFDRLEVRTGDGRVDVDARPGSKVRDGWRIETADGPLKLRIPRDLAAELDARTGDGHLYFDLPVQIGGRMDPHAIRGLINGGGSLLRLRTGDGSLTLGVSD